VVQKQDDGRFFVETSKGTRFLTKTMFIAGGVGSFQPRTLKVDGSTSSTHQLFYRVRNPAQFAGKNLVIVGGGDSALDWALNFVQDGPNKAESVILMHRRDGFRPRRPAWPRCASCARPTRCSSSSARSPASRKATAASRCIKVTGADAVTRVVPLDMLLVFFGLSPKLGPIADWGLGIERKQIVVDTEKFETSIPGIFAVGDINTYPGKKKLILSGFHEAALAAFGAAPIVFPDKAHPAAVHHHQPEAAQGAGRGVAVFD
jgi:thioredoxin reductase (NADPH)